MAYSPKLFLPISKIWVNIPSRDPRPRGSIERFGFWRGHMLFTSILSAVGFGYVVATLALMLRG